MTGGKAAPGKRRVRRIAINGRNLDEIGIRVETPHDPHPGPLMGFPVERHAALEDNGGLTLRIPALAAVQLYVEGTLPQDRTRPVVLTLAGKTREPLYLHWVRVSADLGRSDTVLLRFEPHPPPIEPRADPKAWLAGLNPLKLYPRGEWDPAEAYWGDEGVPIAAWAKAIIKRGPRPQYEMEQVLPGQDPEDPDSDPILESNELKAVGKIARARKLLERLIIKDLRCLDAHAHLGNLVFDEDPRRAIDHFQRGVQIGELSLGGRFDGVLPWGLLDNRPYLRCLNGLGLCLWRLDRYEEAEALFERMLWLCPSDNLGVRVLLPQVRAGKSWAECQHS